MELLACVFDKDSFVTSQGDTLTWPNGNSLRQTLSKILVSGNSPLDREEYFKYFLIGGTATKQINK